MAFLRFVIAVVRKVARDRRAQKAAKRVARAYVGRKLARGGDDEFEGVEFINDLEEQNNEEQERIMEGLERAATAEEALTPDNFKVQRPDREMETPAELVALASFMEDNFGDIHTSASARFRRTIEQGDLTVYFPAAGEYVGPNGQYAVLGSYSAWEAAAGDAWEGYVYSCREGLQARADNL